MGYSGIYRVATCCIIVQMVLLTVAIPTEKDKEPEKVGKVKEIAKLIEDPVEAVKEVIIKQLEIEPDTHEDKDTTYHKTFTGSDDLKLNDNGRRIVNTTSTVDSTDHQEKTTLHNDNKLGKETKVSNESTSSEEFKGTTKELERNGTQKRSGVETMEGTCDDEVSSEFVTQETDHGTLYRGEEMGARDKSETRRKAERYVNTDMKHVEATAYNSKEDNISTENDHRIQSGYVHDNGDNYVAAVNVERVSNSDDDHITNTTYKRLKSTPESKMTTVEKKSLTTNVNKNTKQNETVVQHKTPVHVLHLKDQSTEDEVTNHTAWEHDNEEKTVSTKDGTTVQHSKTEGESDHEYVERSSEMNLRTMRNTTNAVPVTVTVKSQILDKDKFSMEETKNIDFENKKKDGSKRTKHVVEVTQEEYDMHTLAPGKKHKIAIATSARMVPGTEKSTGTSTDKSTGTSTDKSTGTSTDKSTGTSTDKSKGTSTDKSKGTSTDKSTGTSTDKGTATHKVELKK